MAATQEKHRRRARAEFVWVASLALCVAASALWVRGRWLADTLVWRTGHPVANEWQRMDYMTRAVHGRVVFWRTGRLMREIGPDPAAAQAMLQAEQTLHHWSNEIRSFRRAWPDEAPGVAGWLGFRWREARDGTSGQLGVPIWTLVGITAVLPGLRLRRFVRERRGPAEAPLAETPATAEERPAAPDAGV